MRERVENLVVYCNNPGLYQHSQGGWDESACIFNVFWVHKQQEFLTNLYVVLHKEESKAQAKAYNLIN